jgi:hypothetical protein
MIVFMVIKMSKVDSGYYQVLSVHTSHDEANDEAIFVQRFHANFNVSVMTAAEIKD